MVNKKKERYKRVNFLFAIPSIGHSERMRTSLKGAHSEAPKHTMTSM